MPSPSQILVRRYLRRHPKTPETVARNAVRTLRRLKADKDFEHICHVQLSDMPSQVLPMNGRTFRRHACSITNIEPGDVQNEVRAATTIQHEGVHARVIAKNGEKAITKENEMKAHVETIEFLKNWRRRETRADVRRQIDAELADEQLSIEVLRTEP